MTPIQTSGGGGGPTYTAGSGISLAKDIITNTKQTALISGLDGVNYPDVDVLSLNGLNISTANANSTLTVAAHTPFLAFDGFSGVEDNGVVTLSSSNFTYYARTIINIDGANIIRCDLAPLIVLMNGCSYVQC